MQYKQFHVGIFGDRAGRDEQHAVAPSPASGYNMSMANYFVRIQKWFQPCHVVRRVHDVDYAMLMARGIRGVMLDLDNTLVPCRRQDIFPGVEAWIAGLWEAGLRACLVTNAQAIGRVRPVAERLGIPWVTHAYKPFSHGFRRAMRLMGTTPQTSAMIGDLISMDIVGGNRLGLYTVLIAPPVRDSDLPTRLVWRPLDRCLSGFVCKYPR